MNGIIDVVMMENEDSSPLFLGGRIPGYPTMSSVSSLLEKLDNSLGFDNKPMNINLDDADNIMMEAPQLVSTLEPLPAMKTCQRKRCRNLNATGSSSDEFGGEDSQHCAKRLKVTNEEETKIDEGLHGSDEVMQVINVEEAEVTSIHDDDEPKEAIVVSKCDEEIKAHLQSLLSSAAVPKKCSDDEVCQLCLSDELLYAATPIYCSSCSDRIKARGNYYVTPTTHDAAKDGHCFCSRCYQSTRSGRDISFGDDQIKVPKASLEKKKNDEKIHESWVQCGRCDKWQHQICGLYNPKCDLKEEEDYVCFKCLLKDAELGEERPKKTVGFCAKDLPTTMLSEHMEKRLAMRLDQERQGRMSMDQGNASSAILGVEGLIIREVLSVEKTVKVKQRYLDLFTEKNYPAEFPYKSKVITMFQKIDGVDVCIFAMYVEEFSAECSYHPNKGCVYISYLDSVKYFRPAEGRTVTGEALRTFVYHELLIGYLEFCKKQGFVSAYIWACPPAKEENYILYCHPPTQKTPLPIKLCKWYQSMIKKASNEGIVVGSTTLYDRYFVPSSTMECNNKVTAARLPHFDGDYWSTAAQDLMKEISTDEETKIRKRTLEAMGHTNDSHTSTKDILLMQKLGDAILADRENFMVVDLQYVCILCNDAILAGEHWSCSQCKTFHVCEKCHRLCGGKETHMTADMTQHSLSRVTLLQQQPASATEEDVTLNNGVFKERTSFVNFCMKNHYQFDTLRHAKYSSMMILHHLSDLPVQTSAENNKTCRSNSHTDADQGSVCEISQDKSSSPSVTDDHATQVDKLTALTEGLSPNFIRGLNRLIEHVAQCYPTNGPCTYQNCSSFKKLFRHPSECKVQLSGGCKYCEKAWTGMVCHSRQCSVSNCVVPRCKDLKDLKAQKGKTR